MTYVCDDCGELDEDEVVFEGAGKCPHCGKEALSREDILVEKQIDMKLEEEAAIR